MNESERWTMKKDAAAAEWQRSAAGTPGYSRPPGTEPLPDRGSPPGRLITLVWFTLLEYGRSGRIWIEIGLMLACFVVFLRADRTVGVEPRHFFLTAGLFMLALTFYTISTVVAMGDRPQNYLLLVRRVGRATYLLGLYGSAMLVLGSVYAALSGLTALVSRFDGLSSREWLLGSVPLLLNCGLLAALVMMLSPLVFSSSWRLFVMSLIALAFSSSFLGSARIDAMPDTVRNMLTSLQTLLSWPLVPAFSGFALSLSRDYSGNAVVILVAQAALLVALLSLAVYSFAHRELLLNAEEV